MAWLAPLAVRIVSHALVMHNHSATVGDDRNLNGNPLPTLMIVAVSHPVRGGGGRLGALLVHLDEGLVQNLADVEFVLWALGMAHAVEHGALRVARINEGAGHAHLLQRARLVGVKTPIRANFSRICAKFSFGPQNW